LLQNTEILKNHELMFETFKNSEFDENFYTKGVQNLSQYKIPLEKLILKLCNLNRNGNFNLFPLYQIILTKYGPGGSYDKNTGKVTIFTTEKGEFGFYDPIENIVHEIIHIGIEKSIVEKYKLSHGEKENLVDLIARYFFKEETPNYQMQPTEIKDLGKYVNEETIYNLTDAIENYKTHRQKTT